MNNNKIYRTARFTRGLITLILILLCQTAVLASYNPAANTGSKFVPGEIIVKFKPGTVVIPGGAAGIGASEASLLPQSIQSLNRSFGATGVERIFKNARVGVRILILKSGAVVEVPDLSNYYKIKFSKDVDVPGAVSAFGSDPSVENAEPNYIMGTCQGPDDPKYVDGTQWGLYKVNLNPVGSPESGWNETEGTTEIAIAVVDTGVDWSHPDLEGNIWINTDEDVNPDGIFENWPTTEVRGGKTGDEDGIDNDGNGFVDDVAGWNFVDVPISELYPGERSGPGNDPVDFDGHGTHVSGIASAVTSNELGVAGTAWHCKIMAVRSGFKGRDGYGYLTDSDAANGVFYAASMEAKVINMSWGSASRSSIISDAIAYARASGCTLVAAAGNSDSRQKFYPAALPGVIAVGATDKSDVRSIWASSSASNFGPWVKIYAPGGSGGTAGPDWIYSTFYPHTYAFDAGTSMASPFVAGAAALVWTKFPTWDAEDISSQLENTALNKAFTLSTGIEKVKRLDVYRALLFPQANISSPAYNSTINPGRTVSVVGTARDLIGGDFSDWVLEVSPYPYASWTTLVSSSSEVNNSTLGTWTAPTDLGLHRLRLRVSDTSGNTMEAFTTVTIAKSGTLKLDNVAYGPNPFNPRAGQALHIRFILSKQAEDVDLNIFDISGNLIWKKRFFFLDAGNQDISWDGRTVSGGFAANGVYLFQIIAGDDLKARGKIILFK